MSTRDDDDLADLPELPELSENDEAFVRGLLAALPPVPVPVELAARLDAALRAAGAPADADAPVPVAATVVPLDPARIARTQRRTRVLQVAAAALVLVAGGWGVVKLAGTSTAGTSAGSAAGAGALAPSEVGSGVVTHSGHAYDDNTLVSDVRSLTSGSRPTTGDRAPGTTPQAPSPGPSATSTFGPLATGDYSAGGSTSDGSQDKSTAATVASLFASRAQLVPCLAAVEADMPTPMTPLAMDAGTYRGQPALVVVLPGSQDPAHAYDVWVVGAACGQNGDVHLLKYELVKIR